MNLSFSTRGWNSMSWDEQVGDASEMGFKGIEPYNIQEYPSLSGKSGAFHPYMQNETMRSLRKAGITLVCFDTSIDLSIADEPLDKAMGILRIAASTKTPYVAFCALREQEEEVRMNLGRILPAARDLNVCVLMKTVGIYADTDRLRKLMDDYACDELAALWDMHHPFRDFSETPDRTIRNLGGYVKHVHLRDSNDDLSYNLIGEGTLPVRDMMNALSSIDYNGFISLEWKPEWMPDIPDREIIFSHFLNYMNRFENPRGKKKSLYFNHDGTGKYIWKKDELIDMTFGKVLDRLVEEFPDQYAFKYTTLDYTRTYEEFRNDVDRFARALISMGVRAGSKVAIWATNVPAWYITFWAATRIGAVLVTVNTAYKIHEAEYLLRQSDTHTLVMIESALDSNYRAIINELCPELVTAKAGEPLHCKKLPFLRNVITVGYVQQGCLTFEEAMKRADSVPQEKLESMAQHVKPDDVCNMQYTSGTTGFPKGVMLTHYNVVNDGKCIGDRMGLSTADRMMIQVPMFHCFGMVLAMTASMTHGTTLCPLPYFSAKNSLACINQERITCFHGVPTMFIAMFNHEDYRKTDFSYMRTGIMAGSGCPPELMKRAAQPDEMNMRGIVSVYGQTESSPGSTMSAWTDPIELRTQTVGYSFPHIQTKVIDPETGKELPDGQDGEFCSRGYHIMKGYYKMPDATNSAIDSDGWLHSGDLARRNKDGTYLITGRLKDMIIRGGEKIYPKEIEEFIYTHPAVADVQVIGVPDAKYGEAVMACIILKEGQSISAREMTEYIKTHMARHKVPQYIEFVDSFPMNAAGKVLKYRMREEAARRLGLVGAAGIDTAGGVRQ